MVNFTLKMVTLLQTMLTTVRAVTHMCSLRQPVKSSHDSVPIL